MGNSSFFFIDKYFRFGYVCLVHGKFDASDKFIKFKVELDNLLVNISNHFDYIEVVFLVNDSFHKEHEIIS